MTKVANEVAVQEFERWLDYKRIKQKKREDNKSFEETIVQCIEDGEIAIDDNCVLTFTLPEILKDDNGNTMLEKLIFPPRVRVKQINNKMKGFKSDDADARVLAYISAISGQNTGVISNMYTEDYSVCQSIVMYFL